ncbi:hypothetical protein SHVI106290_20615 [Shewanella violacea]
MYLNNFQPKTREATWWQLFSVVLVLSPAAKSPSNGPVFRLNELLSHGGENYGALNAQYSALIERGETRFVAGEQATGMW